MDTNTVSADPLAHLGFDRLSLEDAVLTALSSAELSAHPPEDRPQVLPALHSYMSPDLLASADGQVMLIHEKPLPAPIWWADYDPEYNQLIFVTVTGQIVGLGAPIPPSIDVFLRLGQDIALVEINARGEPVNVQERKIVVRKNGWK